ncbi:MAG: hypothetical protein CMM50_08465 [Rhodospirillaceae bacterium]|nr:hypothetical protein [Rhodospirillaceae bacterium]
MSLRLPVAAAFAAALMLFSGFAEAGRADVSLVTGARGKLMRLVESSLAQGAAIDTRDGNGRTALSWAAFHGDIPMMRLLLSHGAGIDVADKGGRTPLMWAAIVNRPASASFLLNSGADAAMADDKGMTAADHAEAEGHDAALVQMLRDAATP